MTLRSSDAAGSRGLAVTLGFGGAFWILVQLPLGLHGAAFGSGFEVLNVARSLAFTGHFANPYSSMPTGPTAHVAPLYPLLIAPILRLFSEKQACYILFCLSALAVGCSAAQLPGISLKIFRSRTPGVLAAGLLVLTSRVAPQQELSLSLALMVFCSAAILNGHIRRSGILFGLAMLCTPISILALPMLMLIKGRRFCLGACAIAFVIVLPWIVRNWLVMGAPYFIRDDLGLELALSNNSQAHPDSLLNGSLHALHPMYNPAEAMLVARMGEGSYNRSKLWTAAGWCATHPRRFASLCVQHAVHYWLPPPIDGWPAYFYTLSVLLGAAGFWISRLNRWARAAALAALFYCLPFVLIQSDIRYPYPAIFIPCLFAARFAVWIAEELDYWRMQMKQERFVAHR